MVYCYTASVATSVRRFVLEPRVGCYQGVVVADGESLYSTIMSELGI